MKSNCPSCGAEVTFKSSISVFSVCDFCKSMLVRHDMDLETLGQMAQLPDDVSPLKIGSRGKYKNSPFEVIGRLKVAWSEGYWNEWFLLFDNGKNGWLAEAMGFFMMSEEVKVTDRVPKRAALKVGNGYELAPSEKFFVDDIKEAVCIGSQGELPFKGLHGRKTISVDLSNYSGEFVNIEYSDQDSVRLYAGRYVEFEELGLSNLRDLRTEMKKIRGAELFKCPSCGGPFSILTPGLTASVACKYCGSTIDATNQTLSVLSKAEKKLKVRPLIPIGDKGNLSGVEWEVVGFMRRSDESGEYTWDEYLMFNPYKGFRWLTAYNGHWNYVELMQVRPFRGGAAPELKYRDRTFKKFLEGKGRVQYVIGEFYWRVRLGDTVTMTDYICPPEILSCESEESEINWSLGRYIEPQEVAAAFGLKEEMPRKKGVAPNQPSPYGNSSRRALPLFLFFAMCLTVLQIYFVLSAPEKDVYQGEFRFNPGETSKTMVSPSFDLPGNMNNLAVNMYSPLQDDWVEAGIDLVDEATGRSLGFEQGVEYYSGTDSDGSWSEGSKDTTMLLSSVPGGRYHLVVQPAADVLKSGEKSFRISLRRGIATWCNYFLALFLLSVYPVFICLRSRSFELKRWAESDISGNSADDGDEAEGE